MKRILLAVFIVFTILLLSCSRITELPETRIESSQTPEIIQKDIALKNNAAVTAPEQGSEVLTPAPSSEPVRIEIVVAGDLMCLNAQLNAARKDGEYKFYYCFSEIKNKISAADLAIGNLETLVAQGYKYTQASQPGNPKINAPESYLSAVVDCGFDVLVNANNHIYDRKSDGINKTVSVLDKYAVKHTGAYAEGQARIPLIEDVKGIKVAVLSYTDHINGHINTDLADKYSEKLVKSDIDAVKAGGADFIIVYMHWGTENTHKVNKEQRKMAAFVANTGADIIIGSHPHCTQGADNIKTEHGVVPVFYSLGNLVSSMGRTINGDSALVNMTLEKDAVTGVTALVSLTYTATLCSSTEAGRYVILPAGLGSIAQSNKVKALEASRRRTVDVIGNIVAVPE